MENLGKIVNWVGFSTSIDEKMQTLKRKCDTLCSREGDVVTQLERAESSSTKKRRKEVENWLGNVARTRNRVQNIELRVSERGSLGGKKLADCVEDVTKEVAELMEQGQFCHGLTLDARVEMALLAPKLVGLAFERNLEIIWEHLRNDEVLMIGVWGMGGVGKTTLVAHVHNRIQQSSDTFDHVYWITVSQNSSIYKLQEDIAKAIDLDISAEDDERKRAARLSRGLLRVTRSVLVLDDVWNDVCLERVGIATAVNGCKLLITTRSLDVCRRLGCQEKIWIHPLSKEEAWNLFEKTLRHPMMALSVEVLEVAKSVAQECAGLPLGIITLASCMREVNDVREWRDVLQALKESEDVLMEENVFKVLKFSYNRLNDPIVQKCFLYCALYPEDYEIEREELIQYLIDERLIGKMRNREAQFDRGHAILNKLVNSCLLEVVEFHFEGYPEGVKMHDLVRDMAIKITGPQFMVKAGMQLGEIPEEQKWSQDVERVSLTKNDIKEITTGKSPRCPRLLTLFLSYNASLKRIESSFFEHMFALQVLNLSECAQIEELPCSVSNLTSLTALVLSGCSALQCMPSLAEMKLLNRLDLKRSGIREVPRGLEMLVNLAYLDLSDTNNLDTFPSGILPELLKLEYLKFGLRGVKVKGEELRRLEKLGTFQGRLVFDDCVKGFKDYVMSRRRYIQPKHFSYLFVLDNGDKYVEETCNREDNLYKLRIDNWCIRKRTKEDTNVKTLEALVKDVPFLEIDNCKDFRSLSDVMWLDKATRNLRRCSIQSCEGIECVGSVSNPSHSSPLLLQTLEMLSLRDLQNLRVLLEGERQTLPEVSISSSVFSCLKSFTIIYCNNIKKLFQPWFLPYLQNLEVIHVHKCCGLEEIISSRSSDDSCSNVEYTLPRLKILSLNLLPKLKSVCEGTLACEALKVIEVLLCPKLESIHLSQPLASLPSIHVDGSNREELLKSMEYDHHQR